MLIAGAIDYVNYLPLFAALRLGVIESPVEWISAVPSALNRSLREGRLDVSPISAAEYLAHRSQYELLPDFCIGAEEKVMSVNLYVKDDLALLDGCVIGLTSQSASSALLVKVMCHHFWRVNATYHVMKDPSEWRNHDAFLLIGDDCLLTPTIPGYITIDLAAAWYQETQLPFTFAIFAARKEVMQDSPAEIQSFLQAMQASYAWSKDNSEAIYKLARQRLPSLSVETLDEYYRTIKYELSDRQLQGMTLFHELANALPTEPEAAYARL